MLKKIKISIIKIFLILVILFMFFEDIFIHIRL
jgi:hypothetical protein